MQSAAEAYKGTARVTEDPRQLEASLLLEAASQLQKICDNWPLAKNELDTALMYNRRLWTVFVSSATEKESPLPLQIKNNILSLGSFIFWNTIEIEKDPRPEQIDTLININREIAAGLRATQG